MFRDSKHQWLSPPVLRGRSGVRLRRALSVSLFLLAAVVAVRENSTATVEGTPTVVAAHRIAPGSRLDPSDVTLVRFPDRLRPADAFRNVDRVVGRVLSGAASQGSAITRAGLLGSTTNRAGTTTVPVRLADPGIARLLEPGTKVDVVTLADAPGESRVLASGVTVLTVTNGPGTDAGPTDVDGGPLVLLSVPNDTASTLAATALSRPVTVTLR